MEDFDGTIVVYWNYENPIIRLYAKADNGLSTEFESYFQKPFRKTHETSAKKLGVIGGQLVQAVMKLPAISEIALGFDVLAVLPRPLYNVETLQDELIEIMSQALGWKNPLVLIALQGFSPSLPKFLPGLSSVDLAVYDEIAAKQAEADASARLEREREMESWLSGDLDITKE